MGGGAGSRTLARRSLSLLELAAGGVWKRDERECTLLAAGDTDKPEEPHIIS